MGSHFASKAMGACSRELRAKIFARGEIPEGGKSSNASCSIYFLTARRAETDTAFAELTHGFAFCEQSDGSLLT